MWSSKRRVGNPWFTVIPAEEIAFASIPSCDKINVVLKWLIHKWGGKKNKRHFRTWRRNKRQLQWTERLLLFCSSSCSGCWFTATRREPSVRAATSCRPLRYSEEKGFTLSVCGGWCYIHVFSLKFRTIGFLYQKKQKYNKNDKDSRQSVTITKMLFGSVTKAARQIRLLRRVELGR